MLVTALSLGTSRARALQRLLLHPMSKRGGVVLLRDKEKGEGWASPGSLLVAFSGSPRVVPVSTCQAPSFAALGVSKFQSFKLSEFEVSKFEVSNFKGVKFQSFKVSGLKFQSFKV